MELLFMLSQNQNHICFEYEKSDDFYILSIKRLYGNKLVHEYLRTVSTKSQLAWLINNKTNYYEQQGFKSRPINMYDVKGIKNQLK